MTVPAKSEHLLPETATPLEKALSASDARILDAPVWIIRAVWDPDLCPGALLPYLAQAWSVDEWDPAWSEAQKRQVIKDSVWIHRHKGTIGTLRRAIAQLGLGATVERWFEQSPPGAPYTFRLYVKLDQVTVWTGADARRLLRVAINNKAVRSYLDAIGLSRPPVPSLVTIGAGMVSHQRYRQVIAPLTAITPQPANVYIGAATLSRQRTWLMPA